MANPIFKHLESIEEDDWKGRRGSGHTRPARFDFKPFFDKLKKKNPEILLVGLGGSKSPVSPPPMQVFELAEITNGKITATDVRDESVEKAKQILKNKRIVLSKRFLKEDSGLREAITKDLEESPLKKYVTEDKDFLIINLPKKLTDKITISQADVGSTTPSKKMDVAIATFVGHYIKPFHLLPASMNDSLKKDGHLIIDKRSLELANEKKSYSKEDVHKTWEGLGFKIKQVGNGDRDETNQKPTILQKKEDKNNWKFNDGQDDYEGVWFYKWKWLHQDNRLSLNLDEKSWLEKDWKEEVAKNPELKEKVERESEKMVKGVGKHSKSWPSHPITGKELSKEEARDMARHAVYLEHKMNLMDKEAQRMIKNAPKSKVLERLKLAHEAGDYYLVQKHLNELKTKPKKKTIRERFSSLRRKKK